MWLILCIVLAYATPGLFPDPALAFYIARGWLGCLTAYALWRGWRIPLPALAVALVWEGSSALCGVLFAKLLPLPATSMCDAGTGLPITWPALAVTLLVCGHLMTRRH